MDEREALVLAAMSRAGDEEFTPMQVQKLLFLIEREVLEGEVFEFTPGPYGAWDLGIYGLLRDLEGDKLVRIGAVGRQHVYACRMAGVTAGQEAFEGYSQRVQDYMARACEFVRSVSFAQLVGSVNRRYPEMAVKSVFWRGS